MPPFIATLLAQGLGLLGNAVLAKGKDVIEKELGVDIESMTQTPEGLLKLKQLEVDHEEYLLDNALKQAELGLKDKALDIDNTKNARDTNARIQESERAAWLAKNSAYILDWLIVGATIVMIYALFRKAIPAENMEVAYLAVGSLLTMCGTVLNFHRGSSSGSVQKSNDMVKLLGVQK